MPFESIVKDVAYYKAAYKRQVAITRQLEAELTRVKEGTQ